VFILHRLILGTVVVLFLLTTVLAQEDRVPVESQPASQTSGPSGPLVIATATGNRVRFVSPGTVVQLRLEIYDQAGRKMFDTELRGGNVLDWNLLDGAGDRLPSGSYACVLTSKTLSGRLSQRVGLVSVDSKSASIQATGVAQFSLAQQQAIGPVEGQAGSFTVLNDTEAETLTTVTHDGVDGQVTRSSGALSFRVGNLFSGKDQEQMRLTPDGRLGIGTSEPQANLDVAGTIRAERVFIARPAGAGDPSPGMNPGAPQPLASGSGTQDRIAKWIDNMGTLGDSGITETPAGRVGIGTTNPQSLLHLGQNAGVGSTTGLLITNNLTGGQYNRAFQLAPRQTASPVTNSIMMYALPTVDAGVTVPGQFGIVIGGKLGAGTITSYAAISAGQQGGLGATNNTLLLLGTSVIPSGNFAVFDTTGYNSSFKGNIGVGTSAPSAKLDVRGNIKLGSSGELFAAGADENLRIIRGSISGDGNILSGSGFQVSNPGRGHYVITFAAPFAGSPTVTATSLLASESDPATITAVLAPTSVNVSVRQYCHDLNACSDANASFHFIATGPR